MSHIDLRSDTVTKPTKAMKDAIMSADVGDDVYGEDPTVNGLEGYAAELLGKDAALYCSSGTQSNLTGLLAHCGRGDEYIVGNQAHTYMYEGGGAAVLGSIQPQPLDLLDDATMPLDRVVSSIKPDDVHFARTKLICLENTHSGKCLPAGYIDKIRAICDDHNLGLHLDGARLFNACVKQGESVRALAAPFDSVSICLSKGLGAPIGSLLVGDKALIDAARRWRKMLGGGMRQAGMMAAAGRYALEHNIDRLADDHANAFALGNALNAIDGVDVDLGAIQTNMLFVSVSEAVRDKLETLAAVQDIKLPAGCMMRLVTHLDIAAADIDKITNLFAQAAS